VSEYAANWALPPLELYPERPDERDRWQDNLEAALTALPMSVRPRLGQPRASRFVRLVNRLETDYQAMDDVALEARTREVRTALRRTGLCDASIADAFALVRECSNRHLGLRHYDVQLRGGYAILRGMIAEMETG